MPDINPHEILDSLGVARCGAARRVEGGWDTTIWRVTCEHGEYALRLFREGTDTSADREHEVMQAISDTGVSVPRLHAFGTWNNRRVMLLSWCPGHLLMDDLRSKPWSIRKLGFALGRCQAEMHKVSVSVPGVGSTDWMTRFGPIEDGLRNRLLDMKLQDDRLLHLDLHPMNVTVRGGEIGCILDWQNSATGDPRADVARTWSILRLMPLSSNRPALLTRRARHFLTAGWMRGYQEVAGPLKDMEPFKLWAGISMVHDLQQYVDRPGNRVGQDEVDAIQQKVSQMQRNLGL